VGRAPAKFVRKLSAEDIQSISKTAEQIAKLALVHDAETSKSPEQIAQGKDDNLYFYKPRNVIHSH